MQRAIILLLILLTGCGAGTSPQPASAPTAAFDICQAAAAYIDATKPVLAAWKDAATLAGSTQRINLPDQIEKLQAIRRDFEAINVPSCATAAHQMMLTAMSDTITSYLDFLAQKDEALVDARLAMAEQYSIAYQDHLHYLGKLAAGDAVSTTPTPMPEPQKRAASDLRAAYEAEGYTFKERALRDGKNALNAVQGPVSIEMVLDGDSVSQVLITHELGYDKISEPASFAEVVKLAQIAAPEWGTAEPWITQQAAPKEQAKAIDGRVLIRSIWANFHDRIKLNVFLLTIDYL